MGRACGFVLAVGIAALAALGFGGGMAFAQPDTQTVAFEGSLTGSGAFNGVPALEGARLAVAEANQAAGQTPITLTVSDDRSSPQLAAAIARGIVSSAAVAVVGPTITASGIAAGPIFASGGLAAIDPTATGDSVPDAATTYQAIFNASAMGTMLGNYLSYVLHGGCAELLYRNDPHGQPVAEGFTESAGWLEIAVTSHPFDDAAGRAQAVSDAMRHAGGACHPAMVLAMQPDDAVPVIEALRRGGFGGPILSANTIADDNFAKLFANTDEERYRPGFFTNNLYAVAPVLFDSADYATLAFVQRFHARYGHAPSWPALQSYDATSLAIAGVRQAVQSAGATAAISARRQRVLAYLAGLNSPDNAFPGVIDPIWFNAYRDWEQPLRMGSFQGRLFVSAPLQLVPVPQPDPAQIKSGELRNVGDGYARIQQVVYTGIYLNDVPRLDIANANFTADFYLWLRYAPAEDIGGQDPSRIEFPELAGSFDWRAPALERSLPDGSIYKLWHVRGVFKNDFDLHGYPFDRQRLIIQLFNATADSTRIVYVLDRQSFPETGGEALADGTAPSAFRLEAAPAAFRDLSQWKPRGVQEVRSNLVTFSALGDPILVGMQAHRELSGFEVSIDVERRVYTALSKSLFPLALITMIMFSSLFFPPQLVKEKVTVAVTGALSGVVLQTSMNTQLGGVGYSMVIDYIFYVFYALSLLCIVSVLAAERFRAGGDGLTAGRTEVSSRVLFVVVALGTAAAVYGSQN
jgi:ABC-type branched-subunit amino acid transport system substrate-binding protein